MGLSLAQSSRKNRVGADPRNTEWANDTSRFGHQQLLNMGWKPGRGLGYSFEGAKEHVKVQHKTDSKGLGYEIGKADQPTGLDVFQKILGKLNGNSEEVEKKQQQQQSLSGLYMHFVPGGVLEGTVKSKEEQKQEAKDKTKKEKKRKDSDKQKKKAEKAVEKAAEKAKREAKKEAKADKKSKKESNKDSEITSEPIDSGKEKETSKEPRAQARGIRATRNRYIAMKRQATSDSKSLKEILMQ